MACNGVSNGNGVSANGNGANGVISGVCGAKSHQHNQCQSINNNNGVIMKRKCLSIEIINVGVMK